MRRLLLLSLLLAACEPEEKADSGTGSDGTDGTADGTDGTADGTDGSADGADGTDGTDGDTGCEELPWYADGDDDGFGAGDAVLACEAPEGHVATDGDCDDSDAAFNPGAAEDDCTDPADYNCDGSVGYADADADGAAACEDCDDADNTAAPGADEVCGDAVDNDCDGEVDEADAVDARTYYTDGDEDGFGDADAPTTACAMPEGTVEDDTDCDDTATAVNPGADEVCDGIDNDCDGDADSDASDLRTYFLDVDGDGFGGDGTAMACAPSAGLVENSDDCDDGAISINPTAAEVCDGADNDCDGQMDDSDPGLVGGALYYIDADTDTYGAGAGRRQCAAGGSYTASRAGDCDDSRGDVSPGAAEACDAANTDEDCDGRADDLDTGATGTRSFYADGDSDGYGAGPAVLACDPSPGAPALVAGDCDDGALGVNPGATEVCDPLDTDEDCDGFSDDLDASVSAASQRLFYADVDNDLYGDDATALRACEATLSHPWTSGGDCDATNADINPEGVETAGDGIDQDCDGFDLDSVDYGHTQFPCSLSLLPGATDTVYGWVYQAGVTPGVGQGLGVVAELGVGPVGVAPSDAAWTWVAGAYNTDTMGLSGLDNDEYQGTLTAPVAPGAYSYGWRFSADGGRSWVYADLGGTCGGGGSADGFGGPAPLTVIDTDVDGDGLTAVAYGGTDCDDGDILIYPGSSERNNGLDDDCDTRVDELSVSQLVAGDLVITEVLYDSAAVVDSVGEWIELYNTTGRLIELNGLVIQSPGSGTLTYTLSGGRLLAANDWLVLGKSVDTAVNGGAAVDVAWGTGDTVMNLSNTADTINVQTATSGGVVIDSVSYGTTAPWPLKVSGKSIELRDASRTAAGNDAGASWVIAATTYGAGDFGTPGAATGR